MDVTLEAVSNSSGLIGLDAALAAGRQRWETEPSKPDAFLRLVTDPASLESDKPMNRTPVWILRYSGLKVLSPSNRELHYAYVYVDAVTGEEIFTHWAQ